MATIKCEKVRITIPKGKEWELLDKLQKFGKVELIKKKAVHLEHASLEQKKQQLEQQIAMLNKGIDTLQPFLPKKGFLDNLSDNRIPLTESEVNQFYKEKDEILHEATTIGATVEKIEELKKKEIQLENLRKDIEPFKDVELAIFDHFSTFFLRGFTVSKTTKDTLVKDLQNNFEDIEFYEVGEAGEDAIAMVVAGPKEYETDVVQFISGRVKLLHLTENITGSFKEVVHKSKEQLQAFQEEREKLQKNIEYHANNIHRFYILKDILGWEVQKINTLDAFVLTKDMYVVDFWIDPYHLDELKQLVAEVDEKGSVSVYADIAHGEKKVMLKNRDFFRSFETITTTMGYPEATEIDPTPILTPFFILFFGLALSDAGYGLLLTALTGFLLGTRKIKSGVKEMLTVLFWCGISTIIFGALLGSWFGFVPDDYQVAVTTNPVLQAIVPLIEFLKFSQVLNPVTAIPLMLGIMISLGIIHLMTGYITAFISKVKHDQFVKGLLDDFLPALLILAIVFFGITAAVDSFKHLSQVATYLLIVMFGATVLAKGRTAGWLAMIPVGLLQTFMSAVGLLSETLSYARLLALGISTGVIAGVINTLALLTGGTPFIGPLLVALVMLAGHTLNILLNLLGSYINSSRLQFVEFFPKFMSSSGKPLIPFKRSEEHVVFMSK